MIQKYVDELLEVSTVKEGDEYSLGYYNNGVPVYGLYLKPTRGSVLERIEKKAKVKFQLEDDSENYAQEARTIFFEKLEDYLKKQTPSNEKEKNNMFGYLYNACNNSLTDLARWSKSNRSVYNEEENEFSIVQLLSINNEDNKNLSQLEKEIEDKLTEKKSKSFNYFRIWFNDNKKSILTKKQLAYLEDEQTVDIKNRSKINKTISERIYKNYTEESIAKHKAEEIKRKKKVIEDIIIWTSSNDEFISRIVENMKKENWLLELIYSLSFSTCSLITKACKKQPYSYTKENLIEIREELDRLYSYFLKCLKDLEE